MSRYVPPDVAAVGDLYDGLLLPGAQADRRTGRDHLRLLANRLVEGHLAGHRGAVVLLGNRHPDLVGRSADQILALPVDLAGALDTVARDVGYPGWTSVGDPRPDPAFERCVDACLAGDVATLRTLLSEAPELAVARSAWGHRATLLHYLAANGTEIHRQVVPSNAAEIAEVLLARGADPGATARVYGGEHTTVELLRTSDHPAHAGVTGALTQLLS
jgi:hypothetical protein